MSNEKVEKSSGLHNWGHNQVFDLWSVTDDCRILSVQENITNWILSMLHGSGTYCSALSLTVSEQELVCLSSYFFSVLCPVGFLVLFLLVVEINPFLKTDLSASSTHHLIQNMEFIWKVLLGVPPSLVELSVFPRRNNVKSTQELEKYV